MTHVFQIYIYNKEYKVQHMYNHNSVTWYKLLIAYND
jgi:hypothetical protein